MSNQKVKLIKRKLRLKAKTILFLNKSRKIILKRISETVAELSGMKYQKFECEILKKKKLMKKFNKKIQNLLRRKIKLHAKLKANKRKLNINLEEKEKLKLELIKARKSKKQKKPIRQEKEITNHHSVGVLSDEARRNKAVSRSQKTNKTKRSKSLGPPKNQESQEVILKVENLMNSGKSKSLSNLNESFASRTSKREMEKSSKSSFRSASSIKRTESVIPSSQKKRKSKNLRLKSKGRKRETLPIGDAVLVEKPSEVKRSSRFSRRKRSARKTLNKWSMVKASSDYSTWDASSISSRSSRKQKHLKPSQSNLTALTDSYKKPIDIKTMKSFVVSVPGAKLWFNRKFVVPAQPSDTAINSKKLTKTETDDEAYRRESYFRNLVKKHMKRIRAEFREDRMLQKQKELEAAAALAEQEKLKKLHRIIQFEKVEKKKHDDAEKMLKDGWKSKFEISPSGIFSMDEQVDKMTKKSSKIKLTLPTDREMEQSRSQTESLVSSTAKSKSKKHKSPKSVSAHSELQVDAAAPLSSTTGGSQVMPHEIIQTLQPLNERLREIAAQYGLQWLKKAIDRTKSKQIIDDVLQTELNLDDSLLDSNNHETNTNKSTEEKSWEMKNNYLPRATKSLEFHRSTVRFRNSKCICNSCGMSLCSANFNKSC